MPLTTLRIATRIYGLTSSAAHLVRNAGQAFRVWRASRTNLDLFEQHIGVSIQETTGTGRGLCLFPLTITSGPEIHTMRRSYLACQRRCFGKGRGGFRLDK